MNYLIEDITKIESGVICHQVNCQKVAGGGLALQIRNKFPGWYEHFRSYKRPLLLGEVSWFQVNDDLWIANLYGQWKYGTGKRYTNYAALGSALLKVARTVHKNTSVYIPYRMGCGLGGGNWGTVLLLIEDTLPNANIVMLRIPA